MTKFKRIARLAAGAILVTGIFASGAAPASAVNVSSTSTHGSTFLDTGWGG